jgi:fibronectin-binding autotransporter adhesin
MKPKSMSLRVVLALTGAAILSLFPQAHADTLYWDGGTADILTDGDGISGGTLGNWDTTLLNWDAGASPHVAWTGTTNTAVFGGTAGAVALSSDISVGGLIFNATGYGITTTGYSLNFADTNNTILFNNIAAASITGPVGGTGNVILSASNPLTAGTLTLGGTSTGGWSGTTTVNAGMKLEILGSSSNQALLNTSGITLNGGTIALGSGPSALVSGFDRISNSATITSNGGTITYDVNNSGANAETVGTLDLARGQFNLTEAFAMSSGSSTFTFSGLSRSGASNTSVINLQAKNTAFSTAGVHRVVIGGIGANTTSGQIVGPWFTTNYANAASTDYVVYSNGGSGSTYLAIGANIAGSAESMWTTSTDAYTNNTVSVALSGNRTMNALRNTAATSTITLSDGANGYTLATNGILNGVATLLTIAPGSVAGNLTTPGSSGGNLYLTTGSSAITVSAPINDNGGPVALVKSGTGGVLTLSSTVSNYSGGTFLNAGQITVTADGNLGAITGGVTFNGAATLSGAVTYNAGRTFTINDGAVATITGAANIQGQLTGSGTLVHTDNSVLTLSNTNNTFTGAITAGGTTGTISAVSLSDASGAGNINLGNTTTAGGFTWSGTSGSTKTFTNRQFVLSGTTGGGVITASGATSSDNLIISQNLGVTGVGTKTLTLSGSNTGANTFSGNIANGTNGGASVVGVSKSGTGNWTISGNMSNTGGLTVNGGGALTLSGTNTYSGNTNFSGIYAQLTFAGSQAASPNTTLFMNTNASSMSSVVKFLDDTGNVNGGTATFGGTYRIQSNNTSANANTFFVGNNNTANGGTSSGTTTGSSLAIGTMNWNTVANNTPQVGNIFIQGVNGYRLQINNVVMFNGAGHTAGNINNTNFYPTSANVTLGTVTMATGNAVNGVIPTLVLDGTSSDNRITGAISNASDVGTSLRPVNVTKSSTSTWNLSGANTYTGATSVTGGLLRFTGDSSAANGNVTVSGGALGGNAGSLGGAVTVSSTGGINLADGSVGSLTLGSTLGITGAAGVNNLIFDLGNTSGTSDSILVAGTTSVTTTGAAVINLNQLGGSAGRTATTYTLIGGAGVLDGTNFAKFSLATTAAYGQTFALTNTGNDLQVVATNVTGALPAAFWKGGGNNWSTASNWNTTVGGGVATGTAPDYQTNVTFSTTTPVAANLTTNVLDTDFNINSLTLTNASGNVTIAGTTKMLTIEAAAVNDNALGNGIDSQKSSGTNTISAKVGLASSQTWTVAGGGTLAVSGAITDFGGGYGLTKAGDGNLSLTGATTYTGGNTITGGTLTVAVASVGAFNNGPLTLSGGARLTLSGVNVASASQVSIGTGGGSLFVNKNNSFSTTGILTGSGTLTLADGGGSGTPSTYNFNSISNDFTGGIVANNATLNVNSLTDSGNNIIFNSTIATGVVANNVGLKYGSAAFNPLTLANRAFEFNSAVTSNVLIQNNNTMQAISIGSNLIATGAGAKTLLLDAVAGPSNVFSGNITDGTGGGTIAVAKSNAGNWSLNGTGNTFTGTIAVNAGILTYASAGGANPITFSNTTSTATLSYTGSGQTMSGAINAATVTSGTITLDSSGAGAVNYSNSASLGSAASLNKNLILSGTNTGDNVLAGGWNNNTGGAATITKNGASRWMLSGTNNYTGLTLVNAGTLQFAKQESLYNNTAANWTAAKINVKNGATFAVNVDSAATAGFDSNNLNTLLTNISVASTAVQGLQAGAILGFDTSTATGGTFTQGNAIANSTGSFGGAIGVTKLGAGTLVFDKVNTYTGATTIQAGTLLLGSNDRLSNTTPVTVAGGTLDISTFTNTVASFSMSSGALNGTGTLTAATYLLTGGTLAANLGAGAVTVNGDVTFSAAGRLNASSSLLIQGGTLTLSGNESVNSFQQTGGTVAGGFAINSATDSDLQSGTFSGNLGGSGGINKTGAGTTTITGTNSYTGATNVTSGTLVVNGNIASSSLTTVASGATIGGSGTVGVLTVSSGAFINPGNSPGILNTGDYTQVGTYSAEITGIVAGTEHDQINVTGTVDITGGSLTTLFSAGTYAENDLIFILLNDGVDAITGTYAGLANGALVENFGGFNWTISYFADSTAGPSGSFTGGNDIALRANAIPEPNVAALLGCLGVLLILRRRR